MSPLSLLLDTHYNAPDEWALPFGPNNTVYVLAKNPTSWHAFLIDSGDDYDRRKQVTSTKNLVMPPNALEWHFRQHALPAIHRHMRDACSA